MQRGCRGHRYLAQALLMGTAHYPKGHSKMVDMGAAPGLIPDPDGASVRGELYGVDDKLLARLDAVAKDPVDHMVRRKVTVWLGPPDDGQFMRAWCYFIKSPDTFKWRTPIGRHQPPDWHLPVQDWVHFRRQRAAYLIDLIELGKTGDVSEYASSEGRGHKSSANTYVYKGPYEGSGYTYIGPREYDEDAKGYKGKYPEILALKEGCSVEVATPSGRKATFKREGWYLREVASVPAEVKREPKLEEAEAEYDANPPSEVTPPEGPQGPVTYNFLEEWLRANCSPSEDNDESYCG